MIIETGKGFKKLGSVMEHLIAGSSRMSDILSDATMQIGLASQHAGAGREKKEDEIDMTAGILLEKKTGDEVRKGDRLCTVFGNDRAKAEAGAREAFKAYSIGPARPEKTELIKEIID